MKLNDRHKLFADEYLANGMNGTRAYLAVYKTVKKEKTAEVNASRLLSNAKLKAYIAEKQAELAKSKEIDRDFILNEYIELLDSCKAEGLDGAGTIKDRTNWAKALSQLTKMLGMDAPEKTEVEHKGLEGFQINIKKKDD
jgi:phage terminase small subunit